MGESNIVFCVSEDSDEEVILPPQLEVNGDGTLTMPGCQLPEGTTHVLVPMAPIRNRIIPRHKPEFTPEEQAKIALERRNPLLDSIKQLCAEIKKHELPQALNDKPLKGQVERG